MVHKGDHHEPQAHDHGYWRRTGYGLCAGFGARGSNDDGSEPRSADCKKAAQGAALGALTAYLVESGRGHELNLPKGAKLELELERALYLLKE